MTGELREKINKLPGNAGAYIFKDSQESIIYVGKAKNLKKRVQSHFSRPEQHTIDFTSRVADVDFICANNENEALLLEAQLIKRYQPRYNVAWKDDKYYFFVLFTPDKFPRAVITHDPEKDRETKLQGLLKNSDIVSALEGPFMQGGQLRSYLRELRKIFPFRTCANVGKKPCLYESLKLCPGPCAHPRSASQYKKSLATMRQMLKLYQNAATRIECYDISNLSGTLSVGSMVVSVGGKADKSQYRKFKIKTVVGQNDVASLAEILQRRLHHDEWPRPDLIVLDGGKAQLKAVRSMNIPVIALAKTGGGRLYSPFSGNYVSIAKLPQNVANALLRVRDEAHRFAIGYNKQRRETILK